MKTTVVNFRAGALLDRDTVYVGRAGKGLDGYFGNRHRLGACACGEFHDTRDDVVNAFSAEFPGRIAADAEYRDRVHACRGKKLACFCTPRRCHADPIAAYLNTLFGDT